MHCPPPTAAQPTAYLLAGSVCALLGWSAWARGGTVVALQGPLPWMGLAILVFLAFDRWGHGSQESGVRSQCISDRCVSASVHPSCITAHCPPPTANGPLPTAHSPQSTVHCSLSSSAPSSDLRPLTSGLLFWSGLAFLALLTVQWWNAGRHPYFHPFDQRWVFTPAPHPGWPWAVDRNDAAEMVRWFFPAWALMLALRHARRPAWLATRVAWFLIINAGLLSAFGIAQTLSGTQHIFWVTPLVSHFFASFGYENHAASYFALLFALAAGMLLHLLTGGRYAGSRCVSASTAHRRTAHCPPTHRLPPTDAPATAHRPLPTGAPAHRRTALVTASICAVLCLIGMALSFSRAGLALAVGLSGVALVAAARLFWPRAAISQRVAVVAALIMGLATVFFVVASMGGNPLAREADGLCRTNLEREAESRLFMVRSASRIWATEPWFGVGGWGYRHFVPVHAVVEQVAMGPGDANVHNDALQFLCEFGAVGFGLMLAATIAFAWPLLRSILRGLTPGLALAGTGLLAVLFHSLIDLPFRSPGVLYAWLAVAGVGGASVGGASVGGASVGG